MRVERRTLQEGDKAKGERRKAKGIRIEILGKEENNEKPVTKRKRVFYLGHQNN